MSLGKVLWDGGAKKSHEQSMQVSMATLALSHWQILPHTYRHKWKGGGEGVKGIMYTNDTHYRVSIDGSDRHLDRPAIDMLVAAQSTCRPIHDRHSTNNRR